MGKFKANEAGFRELRNSAAVQDALLEHANGIKGRADSMANDAGGFSADVRPGRNRAHAVVRAASGKSIASCRDRNTLLKAVGR